MLQKSAISALLLLVCARIATPHPAPYSYVDVELDRGAVCGAVVVHVFDVAHELPGVSPGRLLEPAGAQAVQASLHALLDERVSLIGDDRALTVRWGDVAVDAARQGLRVPFTVSSEVPSRLEVHARLFPYDAQHQTFVNTYEGGRLRDQAILDASRGEYRYAIGAARGTAAVAATFVRAGIEHILIGPDHVLFIVALVILGGSLARLLTIVTAFTLGHSVTLSLAVTGLASVPAVIVEPAIALSIVVVGLDNLLAADGRARRDVRPLAAACFGLVHGFGFASVLREFGVPTSAIGVSLLSFNVGVEIGQLAIVAGVLVMVAGLRRQSAAVADRVAFAASALIVIAGAWWFMERI